LARKIHHQAVEADGALAFASRSQSA
jgi:hypothetical protein